MRAAVSALLLLALPAVSGFARTGRRLPAKVVLRSSSFDSPAEAPDAPKAAPTAAELSGAPEKSDRPKLEPPTGPFELDADGFPIVSDNMREPLPQEYIDAQSKALEKLRKEMQRERFAVEDEEAEVLGWKPVAELWNGRAAMFGITVGALTEYWTGESFIQQYLDILKVLGFLDL